MSNPQRKHDPLELPSFKPSLKFSVRLNLLLDNLDKDLNIPPLERGRKLWMSKTFNVSPSNSNNWLENDILPKRETLSKIADFAFIYLPRSYRPRKAMDVEAWLVYSTSARWDLEYLLS